MPKIVKVFGSAGTGKTTFVYEKVLKQKSDDEIGNVVALSFTRAAKEALLKKEPRLKDYQVRTLHSIVFSKLRLTQDEIMTDYDIQEYMDSRGYPYNPEPNSFLDDDFGEEELGNTLLRLWGKLHNEAPKYEVEKGRVHIGRFIEDNYDLVKLVGGADAFKRFVVDFKKYQKKKGKLDYDSMLYEGYREGIEVSGQILILDEAQDLSPLMIGILEQNIHNFDEVYILGDDDQTIYTALNGALAEYLLNKEGQQIILQKSWRLPKIVLDLSMRYIRLNKNRIDKEIEPRDAKGKLRLSKGIPYDELSYTADRETFILARHRKGVSRIVRQLERMEIPYKILGSKEDSGGFRSKKGRVLSALKFYQIIRTGEMDRRISGVMLENFLGMIGQRLTVEIFGKTAEEIIDNYILDKTAKQLIEEYPKLANITRVPISFLFGENEFDISTKYILRWERRMGKLNLWEKPKITVGTIHQAKGLEAERVVLDLSMNAKSYQDMRSEYERRVWFVGMTRAKEELILSSPLSAKTPHNTELEILARGVYAKHLLGGV